MFTRYSQSWCFDLFKITPYELTVTAYTPIDRLLFRYVLSFDSYSRKIFGPTKTTIDYTFVVRFMQMSRDFVINTFLIIKNRLFLYPLFCCILSLNFKSLLAVKWYGFDNEITYIILHILFIYGPITIVNIVNTVQAPTFHVFGTWQKKVFYLYTHFLFDSSLETRNRQFDVCIPTTSLFIW